MTKVNYNANHITVAKALGIILMVIGHARINRYSHDFIYLFHMPLFFFCSGYYFKKEDAFISVVKKRFKKLYIPYFKWTLAVFLLHNIFYDFHIYNKLFGTTYYSQNYFNFKDFYPYIYRFFISMSGEETRVLGGFWFIKILLWVSIITTFFRSIERKISTTMILKFLFYTSIPFAIICRKLNLWIPVIGSLDIIFMGIAFYLSGFHWRRYEDKITYNKYNILLAFICLSIITYVWIDPSMFCKYNLIIYYYICALIGIFLCLGISYLLNNIRITQLYYIGNHTFTILALHFLSFKLISLWIIHNNKLSWDYLGIFPVIEGYNVFYYIAYTLSGIFVPLVISWSYERVKKLIQHRMNRT